MSRSLPPLGDALKALAAEDRVEPISHPDVDELLAYREGSLAPDRAEALREHLVACAECAARLLDLGSFLAAEPPEGEAPVNDKEVAAAWEAMQRRLPGSRPAILSRGRRRSRLALPLAAGVLAATALLASWMISHRPLVVDLDAAATGTRGAAVAYTASSSKPLAIHIHSLSAAGGPLQARVWQTKDGVSSWDGEVCPRSGGTLDLGTVPAGTLKPGAYQIGVYERGRPDPIGPFNLRVD